MQPMLNKSNHRFIMYVLSFLFTLHAVLPVYINSTYLSLFTNEKTVGIIYTISALFTISLFVFIPRILEVLGNYRVTMSLLLLEFISLFGLIESRSLFWVSSYFILSFISVAVINFNMDIFLENITYKEEMGKTRGYFLTSGNFAWIIAPLITSLILTDGDYWKIFFAAAIIIVPVLFLTRANLKGFKDPQYIEMPLLRTLREIWRNKNLLGAFMAGFLLQFFYAWMVIYTPIYLHEHLQFDWKAIGVVFGIMLLPFVLLEAPLGALADRKTGEKEIMTVGFIVMALTTGLMSFITNNNIFLWATLLFMSRVGASMVEIMTETYFFKIVDGASVHFISFYRTMRPWAYLISPLIATILFKFNIIDFKYIFLILGLVMFYGLRFSLSIQDTR